MQGINAVLHQQNQQINPPNKRENVLYILFINVVESDLSS